MRKPLQCMLYRHKICYINIISYFDTGVLEYAQNNWQPI